MSTYCHYGHKIMFKHPYNKSESFKKWWHRYYDNKVRWNEGRHLFSIIEINYLLISTAICLNKKKN